MTVITVNSYFRSKSTGHDVTLTSFVAELSHHRLSNFNITCKIDAREGNESLALIRSLVQQISQENEMGHSPRSNSVTVSPVHLPGSPPGPLLRSTSQVHRASPSCEQFQEWGPPLRSGPPHQSAGRSTSPVCWSVHLPSLLVGPPHQSAGRSASPVCWSVHLTSLLVGPPHQSAGRSASPV